MADRRELILDLLARDKTGPATKSTAGNLKTVGEAAEGAAKSTEKLGKESDKAEDQVQRFGRSAKTAAAHVDDLDGEIENVERELVRLAVAWKEAESAADKADLSKAIRRTQKDLRELNKSKGILGALIPEPAKVTAAVSDVGVSAGQSFSKSFSEAVASASGPASIGVAIAAAIMAGAALPIVGATVAAGILGAAGIGGVIGGLTLAAKDTRVKAAAKGLGTDVSKTLNESAGAFVPVALQGIEKIRGSFKRISGDLKGIFDASSRYVGPLVDGVTGMVEQAIGGVSKAVAKAGPVIDVISRNLPVLGKTIGDVFEKIADRAPEAATALDQVFKVIEGGVVAVGFVVDKLAMVYGALAAGGFLGKEARDNWIKYTVAAHSGADASDDLAGGLKITGEEAKTAAEAAAELNDQLDELFDRQMSADRAALKLAESTESLKKELADGAKTLSLNSEEGRKNRGAVLDQVDAIEGLREARVRQGMALDEANAKYLTDIEGLRKSMLQAGYSKAAVDQLIGSYRKIPSQVKTTIGVSVGSAIAGVATLVASIAKVKSKHITVTASVGGLGALAALRTARLLAAGRAEGGPVTAGTPYIVGEKRPEVFVPKTNGTIVPSVNHPALSSGGGGMGGGGTTVMQIPRGAILSSDRLVEEISKVVRRRGGSVQLVLGGTNA